jgi:hypothetical protein
VVVIDNGTQGEPVIRVEDATKAGQVRISPPATITSTTSSLPPAGGWTSGDQTKKAAAPGAVGGNVALTSLNENSVLVPAGSNRQVIVPTTVTNPPRVAAAEYQSSYGRAADYSRLKGKLEYSAARKQWKLRYVPIDSVGLMDENGGSVVLTGLPDMTQFHDGDFAAVEGALGKRASDAKDFAADYKVRQIQRVQ